MGNTGGGKGFICSPTFHCYCPSWSASKKERKKLARKKDARKRRQQQAELRPYRGQEEKKKNKEERKKTLHANHLAWFMEPPHPKELLLSNSFKVSGRYVNKFAHFTSAGHRCTRHQTADRNSPLFPFRDLSAAARQKRQLSYNNRQAFRQLGNCWATKVKVRVKCAHGWTGQKRVG
jgi:hypothetical protein